MQAQQENQSQSALRQVSELREVQAKKEAQWRQAEELIAINQRLQGELSNSSMELDTVSAELRSAKQELAAQAISGSSAASNTGDDIVLIERENLKVENARMSEVLGAYQEDKQTLGEELDRVGREAREEAAGRRAAKEEALLARQAAVAAEAKLQRCEDRCEKLAADLRQHQETLTALQSEHRRREGEAERQRAEVTELERHLAQHTADAAVLGRQLQQREAETATLQQQLAAAEEAGGRLREEAGKAGVGNTRAQRLVEHAVQERDELKRKLQVPFQNCAAGAGGRGGRGVQLNH